MRIPEAEVKVCVDYLNARAASEARGMECHPEALMLSKVSSLLVRLSEALASSQDRLVSLQRQLGEYECREMQG